MRDLLGFGKTVLAAPGRGGHRRLPALEREIVLRANAIGVAPFHALWARTSPPPKKVKVQSRVPPSPDSSSDDVQPSNMVSRVTALVAEGALSKACKHLLSTGLWDPEDPRVARKLQDLHPVAPAPDLTTLTQPIDSLPRFAWDHSPKGTADRLQALLAIVGRFPRGRLVGPWACAPRT